LVGVEDEDAVSEVVAGAVVVGAFAALALNAAAVCSWVGLTAKTAPL